MKPSVEALGVEEPASLSGMVSALLGVTDPALLLGLLSLVKLANLDITDHGAEQQGGFLRQGAIAEAELFD